MPKAMQCNTIASPILHLNSAVFFWWRCKNRFVPRGRYPCYANDHAM